MLNRSSPSIQQEHRVHLFPPELRTASIVPRWSVVFTLKPDSVANHSFYVALYARQIAKIIDWQGSMANLLFLALTHDLDETITGDIVSPVKSEIIDRNRANDYIEVMMQQRLPSIVQDIDHIFNKDPDEATEASVIVKVADRLDALLFLIVERRMGNGVVAPRIDDSKARLFASWHELPCEEVELQELWHTVMLPGIEQHEMHGGNGV